MCDSIGMAQTFRYLSHPQVVIDPAVDVRKWSLNTLGRSRVAALAASDALRGTTLIVSSAETKALETARLLAAALKCELQVRGRMHENDRSATGFLPPEEFEVVADQFFAYPDRSVRGWETAAAAQVRIFDEVQESLRCHKDGDVLFVGHGGVGTLLFCQLSHVPIGREYDQGPGGGGCYFEFSGLQSRPTTGWRRMEDLIITRGT